MFIWGNYESLNAVVYCTIQGLVDAATRRISSKKNFRSSGLTKGVTPEFEINNCYLMERWVLAMS